MLIASPLSRALMTADLAFPAYGGPREVCALARERLFHASDMGCGPPHAASRETRHWVPFDSRTEGPGFKKRVGGR